MVTVNAMGDACPIPVVKTKNAIASLKGADVVETLVDNEIAVENLKKMADQKGYKSTSEKLEEGKYRVCIIVENVVDNVEKKDGDGGKFCDCTPEKESNKVVVIRSSVMGEGDPELGKVLLKGFIYAISQQKDLPKTMLFYNGGAFITVPTTAGTAAEVTINYVITDVERKRKFVCVDPHDMPIIAVIDPEMMSSMPKGLTASTGMDALTHAIEGYTTKAAWEMTDMFHLEAIKLISASLRDAVENKKEGREGMALGQYIAGMGFSNVGLGIAHSMAHTLGAVYDTPHGVACAMMLPIVMEYNQDCTGEKYREIARAMGVKGVDDMSVEEYRKAAIDAVRKLSVDVGIPTKLEAIKEEDLDFLAESAHADACAPGNPKDASVEDLKDLFRKIM